MKKKDITLIAVLVLIAFGLLILLLFVWKPEFLFSDQQNTETTTETEIVTTTPEVTTIPETVTTITTTTTAETTTTPETTTIEIMTTPETTPAETITVTEITTIPEATAETTTTTTQATTTAPPQTTVAAPNKPADAQGYDNGYYYKYEDGDRYEWDELPGLGWIWFKSNHDGNSIIWDGGFAGETVDGGWAG